MDPGFWPDVLATLRAEFSDLPDVRQFTSVLVRLSMAMLLGALIGWEREHSDSAAGLRTHMLVALGAALFVLAPQLAGIEPGDLSRVLQGVIAGIGFLGAGAVLKLKDEGQIRGLTTAASIWATAAIGITAGLGLEATAVLATIMVLIILHVLFRFSHHANERRDEGRER